MKNFVLTKIKVLCSQQGHHITKEKGFCRGNKSSSLLFLDEIPFEATKTEIIFITNLLTWAKKYHSVFDIRIVNFDYIQKGHF